MTISNLIRTAIGLVGLTTLLIPGLGSAGVITVSDVVYGQIVEIFIDPEVDDGEPNTADVLFVGSLEIHGTRGSVELNPIFDGGLVIIDPVLEPHLYDSAFPGPGEYTVLWRRYAGHQDFSTGALRLDAPVAEDFTLYKATSVPEPSSVALRGLGLVGLWLIRRTTGQRIVSTLGPAG